MFDEGLFDRLSDEEGYRPIATVIYADQQIGWTGTARMTVHYEKVQRLGRQFDRMRAAQIREAFAERREHR